MKELMRMPNVFEKILLVIGIVIIFLCYFFVQLMITNYGLNSFETISTILGLIIIIILIVITAVSENSKEELKIIITQHKDEIGLLRKDLKKK